MTTFPVLEREDYRFRTAPGKSLHTHHEMPVGEVYVHQTAGVDPVEEYPSGDDDPADAFYALNEYAITGKGYTAVDYSALVHTGPSLRTTVGKGRWEYVPAATLNRNRRSKAVCLLGWFGPPDPRYPWTYKHSREPFQQELEAIAFTIVKMIREGLVRPDATILGHRDNPSHPGATGCPGDYLYAKLPEIRRLVALYLAGDSDEIHTIPGGDMLHVSDPAPRLVDTRKGIGAPARQLEPGKVLEVPIRVPASESPSTAIFTVTIVNPAGSGHVEISGSSFGGTGGGNYAATPGLPPAFSSWIAPVVDGKIRLRLARAAADVIVDLLGVVD